MEYFIKKNIMADNYEGALDCALKANRIFEAFLIAYSHPTNWDYFIEYIVERYTMGN